MLAYTKIPMVYREYDGGQPLSITDASFHGPD